MPDNHTAGWEAYRQAVAFATTPGPPPASTRDRLIYGLVQPLVGLRLLWRERDLMRAALIPAGLLALLCAAVSVVDHPPSAGRFILRFLKIFGALAPLPSVLFARHYARLAAAARNRFGFGPVVPHLEPLLPALWRMVKQALLLAVGLSPLTLVVGAVPIVGKVLLSLVGALWALHWIVVDAFDAARVCRPGQTHKDVEAEAERAPLPWFVRLGLKAGQLPVAGWFFRYFAGWCDWLSRPWREEIAVLERHPMLLAGFAAATALLLATPVLNLLFRPIILVAAAHVLGRLEQLADPAALAASGA